MIATSGPIDLDEGTMQVSSIILSEEARGPGMGKADKVLIWSGVGFLILIGLGSIVGANSR